MNWLREQKKNKVSLVDILMQVMIYICISYSTGILCLILTYTHDGWGH